MSLALNFGFLLGPYVVLDKSLDASLPQFPHLLNEKTITPISLCFLSIRYDTICELVNYLSYRKQ